MLLHKSSRRVLARSMGSTEHCNWKCTARGAERRRELAAACRSDYSCKKMSAAVGTVTKSPDV